MDVSEPIFRITNAQKSVANIRQTGIGKFHAATYETCIKRLNRKPCDLFKKSCPESG